MTLAEIQRIRQWHVEHRHDHPVEYHLWDTVLTLWLLGWVGWLPAFAMGEAAWIAPLCLVGMHAPATYTRWRARAHERHRLRCDWLER